MAPSVLSAPPPSPGLSFNSEPLPRWHSKHHNRQRPIRMMARKRAQQRWSALLSRIDKKMRLDAESWASSWAAFVARANAPYKPGFVGAFNKPMLTCVSPSYGAPCVTQMRIQSNAPPQCSNLT